MRIVRAEDKKFIIVIVIAILIVSSGVYAGIMIQNKVSEQQKTFGFNTGNILILSLKKTTSLINITIEIDNIDSGDSIELHIQNLATGNYIEHDYPFIKGSSTNITINTLNYGYNYKIYAKEYYVRYNNDTKTLQKVYVKGSNNLYYSATSVTPPTLQAKAGYGFIHLKWEKPNRLSGAEIKSYYIYKATLTHNEKLYKIVSGNTYTFNDTNIQNGITYYYWIKAMTTYGLTYHSNEVDVSAGVPARPLNLEASMGQGYVNLTWERPICNVPVIGYEIFRGQNKTDMKPLVYMNASYYGTNYRDANVSNGKTYYYYVVAVNTNGVSYPSNIVNIKVDENNIFASPPYDFKFINFYENLTEFSLNQSKWLNKVNGVNIESNDIVFYESVNGSNFKEVYSEKLYNGNYGVKLLSTKKDVVLRFYVKEKYTLESGGEKQISYTARSMEYVLHLNLSSLTIQSLASGFHEYYISPEQMDNKTGFKIYGGGYEMPMYVFKSKNLLAFKLVSTSTIYSYYNITTNRTEYKSIDDYNVQEGVIYYYFVDINEYKLFIHTIRYLNGKSPTYHVPDYDVQWNSLIASIPNGKPARIQDYEYYYGGIGNSKPYIHLNWNLEVSGYFPEIVGYTGQNQNTLSHEIKYIIYRGTSSGQEKYYTETTSNYLNDTNIQIGKTYYYTIYVNNSYQYNKSVGTHYVKAWWGYGTSDPSNEIKIQVSAENQAVPSAPYGLTAKGFDKKISLIWYAPNYTGHAPILTYKIYRAYNGIYALIKEISVNGNPRILYFNDTNVNNGVKYSYYVVAVNKFGLGEKSNIVSATPNPIIPNPPQNVQGKSGYLEDMGGTYIFYVNITWTPPINNGAIITGYKVYGGETSNSEYFIKQVSANTHYYNYTIGFTSSNIDMKEYYYVTALSSAGESNRSNEITVEISRNIGEKPTVPQDLQATNNINAIVLTWNSPAYNGNSAILYYNIYRGMSSGSEVYIGKVSNTNYVDRNVSVGNTYYYYVTAVNKYGESNESNEVHIKYAIPPSAPQNLKFSFTNSNAVKLTWTAPSSNGGASITEYKIYRGTSGGSETLLATVSGNILTYTDSNLNTGVTYYYYVTAVNSMGESPYSNEVSVTLKSNINPPSAPQNLQASLNNGAIKLTWTAPSSNGGASITEYKIYRGTSSGSEIFLTTVSGSTLTYTDSNVNAGTTYYYYVTAVNSAGESPKSNEVNIKASNPITYLPKVNTITAKAIKGANNTMSINLNWKYRNIQNIDFYIYRSIDGKSYRLIGITIKHNFIDSNVKQGKTYYYYITAVDKAMNITSAKSQTIKIKAINGNTNNVGNAKPEWLNTLIDNKYILLTTSFSIVIAGLVIYFFGYRIPDIGEEYFRKIKI